MEQAKISVFSTFKFAFWAIFSNLAVYLPLIIVDGAVVAALPYLRQYIEKMELISPGYLNLLSTFVDVVFLPASFWGVCVFVAARIVYASKVVFSDVIQSLKYIPQFVFIYAVVELPNDIVKFWGPKSLIPSMEELNPENLNVFYITAKLLSPVAWIVVTFLALIWLLYGQLAIPAFIIEKTSVWRAITLSLHRSHRLFWKIIEVWISCIFLVWAVWAISWGGMYVYVSAGGAVSTMVEQFIASNQLVYYFASLGRPILALAYVYLYKYAQQREQAAVGTIK